MPNSTHKKLNAHTVKYFGTDHKMQSNHKREQLTIVEKYRTRIQQLESERRHLSKTIEECYDYIELQKYLAQKNDKKIQQLKEALYAPCGEEPIISIPASKLKLIMALVLILFAVSVFI